MQACDTSIPVVILKLENYGSLGIIRSLGRMGVPLYGVDAHRFAPALLSRYCHGRFFWDVDNAPPQVSIDFLLNRVAPSIGHPAILLPTSDETATFVARHGHQLGRRFVFPQVRPGIVQTLCSKKAMFRLAKRLGIPTAATFFPRSRAEVAGYLREARFPVILKGIDGNRLVRRTGKKMAVARTAEDLLAAYDRMEDPEAPNLAIQEYIHDRNAAAWMFNGYFDSASVCLASFTGKKIRQYPIHAGITSLGYCMRNDIVTSHARRLAEKIGYRGILDMDFCYDERDGQYKLLDVNPRVGATFRLFVGTDGLDVVRSFYLDLTGQPVPDPVPVEGRVWMVEDKDLLASIHGIREGTLSFREWVRSLLSVDETGYFSRDDLFPFIVNWMNHLLRRPGLAAAGPAGAGRPAESGGPALVSPRDARLEES